MPRGEAQGASLRCLLKGGNGIDESIDLPVDAIQGLSWRLWIGRWLVVYTSSCYADVMVLVKSWFSLGSG